MYQPEVGYYYRLTPDNQRYMSGFAPTVIENLGITAKICHKVLGKPRASHTVQMLHSGFGGAAQF